MLPAADLPTIRFARALLAAAPAWNADPPRDTELEASVDYLVETVRAVSRNGVLSVGIEAKTLLIEGTMSNSTDSAISEAAALLHEHDVARMTFVGEVRRGAVRSLLQLSRSTRPRERIEVAGRHLGARQGL